MNKMTHYISLWAEAGIFFAAGLVALRYINSRSWGRWKYNDSLRGKVVVITGANSGIGKSLSSQLASKGAKVIMACRDDQLALTAINNIRKSVVNGELHYKHLDLENLQSVKDFANEVSHEQRIDVLICNAGIMDAPFKMTTDKYERHFQVNHLAHAMLQILLLPKLLSNAKPGNPARIISVTSSLATGGHISESDFIKNSVRAVNFNVEKAYPKSKLYALLFSQKLAKALKEKSVKIYSASPGFALTRLARHKSIRLMYIFFAPLGMVFLRTSFQAAQSILEAAFPSHESNHNLPSGSVIRNCQLDTNLTVLADRFDSKMIYEKTLEILASDSEVEQVLKLLKIK